MPAKKYTDEQINKAMNLREKGLSYSCIGRMTKMNPKSVQRYCLINGAESPNSNGNVYYGPSSYVRGNQVITLFSKEDDQQMLDMAMAGVSRNEIARRLGRAHSSVRNRLASLARQESILEKTA